MHQFNHFSALTIFCHITGSSSGTKVGFVNSFNGFICQVAILTSFVEYFECRMEAGNSYFTSKEQKCNCMCPRETRGICFVCCLE